MSDVDRTVKISKYSSDAQKKDVSQDNLNEAQKIVLELSRKAAQLEEEQARSLELTAIIEQLRKSLKDEQAKSAELEKKLGKFEVEIRKLAEVLGKISTLASEQAWTRAG